MPKVDENLNIPKHFYILGGLEVVKIEVKKFNLNGDMIHGSVEGTYKDNTYVFFFYIDLEVNQYSSNYDSNNQSAFLTYGEASGYLMNLLYVKQRINSAIYNEYKYDINRLLEENPGILI